LETKVRLQLEFLGTGYDDCLQFLVDDAYSKAMQQTAHSREILFRLKSRCPLVLVSNFYGNLSIVLQEFGLDGIFEAVVESAAVGVRKPNPRIFLLGAEALGLPPSKVTAVGDSLDKDIIPAKQAGCRTVWLQGEGWTAYGPSAPEADLVIRSLDELLENNE
jgi:putative hydrolase of the HAD superfamily